MELAYETREGEINEKREEKRREEKREEVGMANGTNQVDSSC